MFGSATASYQVEGGVGEAGWTPSTWDDFCREQSQMQCGNVADDFFHRYEQDIQLMAEAGLKSFRFSIYWSRVMNWIQLQSEWCAISQGLCSTIRLLMNL